MTRKQIALLALAYAALIAHLLFIPYAISPLPLGETLRRFADVRWLELGSDQNVALASRGLMFAPLGLVLAASVSPWPRRRFEILAFFVATVLGCAWAVAVNCAQLWFPARTVSLNNVAAEFVGVMGGALTWSALGSTALGWWRKLASGGLPGANAALSGYVALYLVASLTPFDFATSMQEIAEKSASTLYGLWIAPVGCGAAPCKFKFAFGLIAAIPCGWWFASRRREAGNAWIAAVPPAFTVAVIIELLHFLMISGVSQGASILVRASGIVLGAATYPLRHRVTALELSRVARPLTLTLLVPYLVAVAYVAGWFRAQKLGVGAGLARLHEVVWLPFFYQYYAPYQATMSSTIIHVALYAPVGIACWLWTFRRDRIPLRYATVAAVLTALAAETSKVFLAGRHPDYFDVVIAGVSATLSFAVMRRVAAPRDPSPPPASIAPKSLADVPTGEAPVPRERGRSAPVGAEAATLGFRAVGVTLLVVAALTVTTFPAARWPLAAGLALYAVLLRFESTSYLIALPLLLPVFDLAPYSGRFFWDEFDAVLATTLGVRLLFMPSLRPGGVPMPKRALWLLFFSVGASAAIALWPLSPLDSNAFSSYLSTYNALRIAKGYAWAGAVLWLIWRDASAGRSVIAALQAGLAWSLVGLTISVFWERLQFVGSPEISTVFRASGFVSATHVGGAYLELMLVMLAPFGLAMAVTTERQAHRLFWYGSVLFGACAVLLTLSRAAAAAWLISVLTFAAVWWLKSKSHTNRPVAPGLRKPWQAGVAIATLFGVAAAAGLSTQLTERLALSSPDLSVRVAHWKDTVHLMRMDAVHLGFGMGLGTYPREFYFARAWTQRLPGYRVDRGSGSNDSYLDLAGGEGMYIDQRVAARSGVELRLRGRIRSPQEGAHLSISLCEKSFLNSARCGTAGVPAGPTWQPFEARLLLPPGGGISWIVPPPTALSLHNAGFGSHVEVSGLSLMDGDTELLANGSFEHGLDRWFMTSDAHLSWRVKNTPLQIAFEQGALGVLAWLVICVMAGSAVARGSSRPGTTAAFTAAAVGFAIVGIFDSLLDSPRIILLVALIMAVGIHSASAQPYSSENRVG